MKQPLIGKSLLMENEGEVTLSQIKGLLMSFMQSHQNLAGTVLEIDGKLDKILEAFPNKDPIAHRIVHEISLQNNDRAEKVHIGAKTTVISAIAMVIIGFFSSGALLLAVEFFKKASVGN